MLVPRLYSFSEELKLPSQPPIMQEAHSSPPLLVFDFVFFLDATLLSYHTMVLICFSLKSNDVEHHFIQNLLMITLCLCVSRILQSILCYILINLGYLGYATPYFFVTRIFRMFLSSYLELCDALSVMPLCIIKCPNSLIPMSIVLHPIANLSPIFFTLKPT